MNNGENGTLKIPTVGRMVYYYPEGHDLENALLGNPGPFPAIVLSVDEKGAGWAMLSVHTWNSNIPVVVIHGVYHKSKLEFEGSPYWDWPEIK